MEIPVLETLKDLGFTEYEAKAYLSLLISSPRSGYAIAKHSGVPRSKIYEVLESLTARGDIIVSPGNTSQYIPLPVQTLVSHRKSRADQLFREAELALKAYENPTSDREHIWNLTGHSAIINKIWDCISNAQRNIFMEIWAEDFPRVEQPLRQAAETGVSVILVAYGEIEADFASVYPHEINSEITEEYTGRWIMFSGDNQEVVVGVLGPVSEHSRAAWSMHQALVMPITEVIIHDLYIIEIMNSHGDILEQTFGKDLALLRHKFLFSPDQKKNYAPPSIAERSYPPHSQPPKDPT